jgi:hypothetical protein
VTYLDDAKPDSKEFGAGFAFAPTDTALALMPASAPEVPRSWRAERCLWIDLWLRARCVAGRETGNPETIDLDAGEEVADCAMVKSSNSPKIGTEAKDAMIVAAGVQAARAAEGDPQGTRRVRGQGDRVRRPKKENRRG